MIKFLRSLRQYKALIIFILFAPILPMVFMKGLSFQIIPENPFLEFEVSFLAPQRNAKEIALKVSEVAERNFNGISGLISLSSISHDEQSTVKLKFDRDIKEATAYLLIQEKLDRIRLEMPSSVDKIDVRKVPGKTIANDLEAIFTTTPSLNVLQKALQPYRQDVLEISPAIFESREIEVHINLDELNKNKVSISQVFNALKVNGLKASIGRQGKIFFGVGNSFSKIEDVKSILISVREHRPMVLSDLAEIRVKGPSFAMQPLKIRLLDSSKASVIGNALKENFSAGEITLSYPKREFLWYAGLKFLFIFLFSISIQFFLQKYFFGKESRFSVTLLFNFLVVLHYVFWKSKFSEITILDLDVISLTEQVGNVMWFLLLARVRYFFLPKHQMAKVPRSLEQATLRSMGELLPAYGVFYLVITLLSLPLLLNAVNLPSSYMLENLLKFGMPINILLIVVLPIIEASRWIRESKVFHEFRFDWKFPPKLVRNMLWAFLILVLLGPILLVKMPWRTNPSKSDILASYRSYGSTMEYLQSVTSDNKDNNIIAGNKPKLYKNLSFTPLGLKQLAKLDLHSFVQAMKEINSEKRWGYFQSNSDVLPMSLSADFSIYSIRDLSFATKEGSIFPLKNLVEESSVFENSEIFREKMSIYQLIDGPKDNLKRRVKDVLPTSWTSFLFAEVKNYSSDHLVYLLFIFFILSIYLNSFIRSLLMIGFLVLPYSFILASRILIPTSFAADSLWMLPVSVCLLFLVILVQTRIVDMERSRGTDRDEAINDLRGQMLMPFSFALVPFVLAMIIKSQVSSTGLWSEGIFISLGFITALYFLNRYIFSIFYLESEEFIEKKIYNFYLFWRKLKG